MKFFWVFFIITCFLNDLVLSQSKKDSVKIPENVKSPNEDAIFLKKNSNRFEKNTAISIEFPKDSFEIPLNLKIYQQVLTDNFTNRNKYSHEELSTGMSLEDLSAFDNNKELSKKLFSDIYGNDIIDLKKILESLGITKDQIVVLAGILKFLFYHPYLY